MNLYHEDGTLRRLIGFDYETYPITQHRGCPRAVCGTLASLEPFPPAVQAVIGAAVEADRGMYEVRGGGTTGLPEYHVALLLADEMAVSMMHLIEECDTAAQEVYGLAVEVAPVLLAQNVAYDLSVTLDHLRLMSLRGDVGEHAEDYTHRKLFRIMDLDGTGLPGSGSLVGDTLYRELLIRIANGEHTHQAGLGDLTKKYLGVDRDDDKKASTCHKCNGAGKVPTEKGPVACTPCGGKGKVEPWRLRYHELDGVPVSRWPKKAVDYALDDAVDVILVALAQAGTFGVEELAPGSDEIVVTECGAVRDEEHQVRASWSLRLSSLSGPRSEATAVDAWEARMQELVEEGERLGKAAGFIRDNGSKNTKVLKGLVDEAYARMGKDAPQTPKGATKTDKDTIMQSRDETLIAWMETGEGRKAASTFIPAAKLGVEHAVASSPGTLKDTGRTSWSKPAFHQPPRAEGFRECWLPRPEGYDGRGALDPLDGNVYISVDWSGAELVALAQIQALMFGNTEQIDIINEHGPGALHLELARQMHNFEHPSDVVDLAEATRRYKAGKKSGDDDDPWAGGMGYRQLAKIGNFGYPGGLAASSFVDYARGYGVTLTEDQAFAIREAWLAVGANAEYLDFFKAVTAGGGATYTQWVGKRCRGDVRYTQACNTGFQGLIGDALKTALWWVTRECFAGDEYGGSTPLAVLYPHSVGDPMEPRWLEVRVPVAPGRPWAMNRVATSPLHGFRSWLSVHDEVLLEGPLRHAPEAAERLSELMVMSLNYYAPDVKNEAPPAIARRWSKGMDEARDASGRLIPWEDR